MAADDMLAARDARVAVYEYARCVVGDHADIARKAVREDVDNQTLMKRFSNLLSADCRPLGVGDMRFQGGLYKYALAEGLYQLDFAKADAADFSAVPPLSRRSVGPLNEEALARITDPAESAKVRDGYNRARGEEIVDRLGECVVRKSPAGAKALLSSAIGAPAEGAAFATLRDAIEDCLTGANQLRASRTMMRGTVALNYYRLADARKRGVDGQGRVGA